MKHLKRYAALCIALVVACSAMAVPASATDYQSTYNFWNWAYDNSWFLGKAIIGFSAGNVCQVSEDGLHHATSHTSGFAGGGRDGERVYSCVCDHCGQEFQAVATDLQQTYYSDDTLPDTVDSAGKITGFGRWRLSSYKTDGCCTITWPYDITLNDATEAAKVDTAVRVIHSGAERTSLYFHYSFNLSYAAKVYLWKWGFYYQGVDDTSGASAECSVYNSDTGEKIALSESEDTSSRMYFEADPNTNYYITFTSTGVKASSVSAGLTEYIFVNYPTVYLVQEAVYNQNPVPYDGPVYSDGDDNSTINYDGTLVDTINFTYYNPVTNTTTNITNWTYDYSDRSYTCTTENNTTTTITYGDEFITINEGDNITYNIYYYTASDSSGDGDSSGSDGSGDDDGGGLLDKIGELIGSVLGGFIDVIGAALGKVIDSLIDLVTLTIDKLVNVINLFGSFGDALGVLWSWLPEEVVTVLVSGVTVIVFASVIKLFMR